MSSRQQEPSQANYSKTSVTRNYSESGSRPQACRKALTDPSAGHSQCSEHLVSKRIGPAFVGWQGGAMLKSQSEQHQHLHAMHAACKSQKKLGHTCSRSAPTCAGARQVALELQSVNGSKCRTQKSRLGKQSAAQVNRS